MVALTVALFCLMIEMPTTVVALMGGEVGVDELVAKGAVRDGNLVKVLGNGELSVALTVKVHSFSASAKTKIEAAGGTATEL